MKREVNWYAVIKITGYIICTLWLVHIFMKGA